jgi:hypothetical protein
MCVRLQMYANATADVKHRSWLQAWAARAAAVRGAWEAATLRCGAFAQLGAAPTLGAAAPPPLTAPSPTFPAVSDGTGALAVRDLRPWALIVMEASRAGIMRRNARSSGGGDGAAEATAAAAAAARGQQMAAQLRSSGGGGGGGEGRATRGASVPVLAPPAFRMSGAGAALGPGPRAQVRRLHAYIACTTWLVRRACCVCAFGEEQRDSGEAGSPLLCSCHPQ